jgi:hypothetical protein
VILTEKFLLPPNIDDAQRQAIVHHGCANAAAASTAASSQSLAGKQDG